MTGTSPNRRHSSTRATNRKWDDVTDWPFHILILPVLVVCAFCLVLFLGSKTGPRLAAVRTWLTGTPECTSLECAPVDRVAAGGSASSLSAGALADQSLSGVIVGGGPDTLADLNPLPLSKEDQLKFDFHYWISEGAKLAGTQSKECDADYGPPFVEHWRKGRVAWCTAPGAASAGGKAAGSSRRMAKAANGTASGKAASNATAVLQQHGLNSTIVLYPQTDKAVHSMFAVSTNTVLDSSAFLGSLPGELPAAPRGSYRAACSLNGSAAPGASFMKLEGVRRWVVDALEADKYADVEAACVAPAAAGNASSAKAHGPVLHPVLLLSRWDTTNAFRNLEEVVSTFLSLAVLDDKSLMTQGLQVVIADGRPDGFYLDLWASLSRPYPLRILPKSPWPPNTCLTRAIHNTFANTSILTSMSVAKRTTCRSPLVMGAALWLRHMLGPAIQNPLRSAYQAPLQTKGITRKTVVWISRRNYEGQAQSSLTPWQEERRFSNEGEVVLELQREVWRWNDEACLRSGLPKSFGTRRRRSQQRRLLAALRSEQPMGRDWPEEDVGPGPDGGAAAARGVGGGGGGRRSAWRVAEGRRRRQTAQRCRQSNIIFDLRVVELSDMPFYPDQLQILGQASVVAGAHGAGLANMIWMPPGKGGVLELHHNSAGNEHYHNQAHLLGHKYVNVESDGDRADLQEVAAGLRKLLDMLGAA